MQKPHAAYYNYYSMAKPLKKWPLIVMIALCVALLIGCIVTFYFANDKKYEQALSLAQAWQFSEAEKISGVLLPRHPQLPELYRYIDAGLMMENGGYENAQRTFAELSGFLDSDALEKECRFRQAQVLFSQENYKDARDMLVQLGSYSEAKIWADESAYRIGSAYYTQLAEAVEPQEIIRLAQNAMNEFSSTTGHEHSIIMLERTSEYIYSLALEAFDLASSFYNKVGEPAAAPAESGANTGETPPATQDMGEENYLALFQDAQAYFNLLPDYMESQRYLSIITLVSQPVETAAITLRNDMWEFAPARKFIFGRYIPQFFYGTWSGGGYGITFTDFYHYYMLSIEDGTNGSYGSGGISNSTKTGWKTAYSFRVLGKDNIEVIGKQIYTLSRVSNDAGASQDSVQPEGTPST